MLHCETTTSAPCSFHVVTSFSIPGRRSGAVTALYRAGPLRRSGTAKATEIGTTARSPPIIALLAAPPDGKMTFLVFLMYIPTALNGAAMPEGFGAPRLLAMPKLIAVGSFFFFFQAEDGIRVLYVTGVQTCALPISTPNPAPQPAASLSVGTLGTSLFAAGLIYLLQITFIISFGALVFSGELTSQLPQALGKIGRAHV